MRRFTQIKGLSSNRRLPRLGKIRLGIRVKKGKPDNRCKHEPDGQCNYCTYPKETSYFVVPPEVEKVYGKEPVQVSIMLPVNDLSVVFPQAYEYYGSSKGLRCTGDGEVAMRYDEDTRSMVKRTCPCEFLEQKKCSQRAHLAVILPEVSMGGVYQIDTSSFNSIIDLNSSLEYVEALVGRFSMVPLLLKREPRETHHDGKKQTHYTLRIELDAPLSLLNQLRDNTQRVLAGPSFVMPAIEHESPVYDDGGVTVEEGEERPIEAKTSAEKVQPDDKPAAKQAEAKPEKAQKPTVAEGKRIATAPLKTIRIMLDKYGIGHHEMCDHFKIGSLEELTMTQINSALSWIDKNKHGGGKK